MTHIVQKEYLEGVLVCLVVSNVYGERIFYTKLSLNILDGMTLIPSDRCAKLVDLAK